MTSTQQPPRRPVLRVVYTPEHQAVLDWLCRQPAKVHDFADIHTALTKMGLKIKLNRMEPILSDLRHERYGSVLSTVGPDGYRLRPRHAYLPHKSPARDGYPPVEEIPVDLAVDHPTLRAVKQAQADLAAHEEKLRKEESIRMLERAEAHGAYRKRKIEAREKAAAEKPARVGEVYVTGYAEAPIHPTTAPVPAGAYKKNIITAPAKTEKK